MISCPWCGTSNEDGSKFCMACGRPVAPAPAPSAPVPKSESPAKVRRSWRFQPNVAMILPAVFILSFVFGLLSLGTAWWSYSDKTAGGNFSVNFLPGSNYYLTCSGSGCGGFSAGAFPYTVVGGGVGGMYGDVLGLVVVCVILLGLLALFSVLGIMGHGLGRWQSAITTLFGAVTILVLFATLIWTAAGQPGTFPAGFYFMGSAGSSNTPDTSFWGSTTSGAASWGAGAGWYLALATVVLLCAALILLPWAGRRRRARTAPVAYSAPPSPPFVSRPYTPPPQSRPAPPPPSGDSPRVITSPRTVVTRPPASAPVSVPIVAPPEVVGEPVTCSTCGTSNPAKSRICSYCQRPLR
jgi:zinc-ribbon domain